MSLVVFLIALALAGLIVGALARLLLPGPDPIGAAMTIGVGLLGSFSAGLFSWYVLHRHGAGLILSVRGWRGVSWIHCHEVSEGSPATGAADRTGTAS